MPQPLHLIICNMFPVGPYRSPLELHIPGSLDSSPQVALPQPQCKTESSTLVCWKHQASIPIPSPFQEDNFLGFLKERAQASYVLS